MIISVLIGAITSSGFWAWFGTKTQRKSLQNQLLVALAHDRILELAMKYINRGSITQEEYENLYVYLYKSYENLGGNGSVKRIMIEVEKLPIRKDQSTEDKKGDLSA